MQVFQTTPAWKKILLLYNYVKGMFPLTHFAISERYVDMLTKVINNDIYIGCLVPFFFVF